MFTFSAAFADISISETDEDTEKTPDDNIIEGYTFSTRFIVEGEVIYNTNNDEAPLASTDISWSVSESDDKDISWLNQYTISNDEVLIIEGTLPKTVTENNSYNLIIKASATDRKSVV